MTVSITACNAFISPYLKELKLQNKIAALSKIETLEVRFIGDLNDPNQRYNAKYFCKISNEEILGIKRVKVNCILKSSPHEDTSYSLVRHSYAKI